MLQNPINLTMWSSKEKHHNEEIVKVQTTFNERETLFTETTQHFKAGDFDLQNWLSTLSTLNWQWGIDLLSALSLTN